MPGIIICVGCSANGKFSSPQGYDLNHPYKIKLAPELNEISGIFFYPKDTSVFAISDASGFLYKIFPGKNGLMQKWKFGRNHDFEDLQFHNGIFYILSSTGDITSIKFINADSLQTDEYKFPLGKAEFETLYFDTTINKLVLVCKECKEDKKKEVSTISFDINSGSYSAGPYKIDAGKIARVLQNEKIKFKPSAAAFNPLTGDLYILSSVNKSIVIADRNGNVIDAYKLNPALYKQPEGIAFMPNGDLLISNESANAGPALIFIIKLKNETGENENRSIHLKSRYLPFIKITSTTPGYSL